MLIFHSLLEQNQNFADVFTTQLYWGFYILSGRLNLQFLSLPITSDQRLLQLGIVPTEIFVRTSMPLKYSSFDKNTCFC